MQETQSTCSGPSSPIGGQEGQSASELEGLRALFIFCLGKLKVLSKFDVTLKGISVKTSFLVAYR